MIRIELSYPPSVNNYYGSNRFGAIYIKAAGKEHIADTDSRFKESGLPGAGDSRLFVIVELYGRSRRAYDIDNPMKCLLDSCTKACMWNDDSQIDELRIRRMGLLKEGKAVVSVYEVGKDDFEILKVFPGANLNQDKENKNGHDGAASGAVEGGKPRRGSRKKSG